MDSTATGSATKLARANHAEPTNCTTDSTSDPSDSPPQDSSPEAQESIASSSSRTSISSTLGASVAHAPIVPGQIAADEFHALVSDLSNYLALGCLYFEDLVNTDSHDSGEQWQEVVHPELLLSVDGSLGSSIAKLVSHRWVRAQMGRSQSDYRMLILRIYILPSDVGLRFIDRRNRRLHLALEHLIAEIDISAETWAGRTSSNAQKFDVWAAQDDGSLFYMFNKLPSPAPSVEKVKEKYTREALEDILDPASVLPGLRTELYPYQRRSAGLMLQREFTSELMLDPRLDPRTAPDGSTFYYGARDMLFFRSPRYYEACCGGILSETMGLGKTVICLAAVLATKHHLPKIPSPYQARKVRAQGAASLSDMVVSSINRKSIPWKIEFERIRQAHNQDMTACTEKLEAEPPTYEIPVEPMRWNRKTVLPPPQRMTLAPTTLVVVPRNLCKQWYSEIKKHVEDGALRILVMEELRSVLPPPDELRRYDLVLFSRNRFEQEIKDGSDDQGRRLARVQAEAMCRCPYVGASRAVDCRCVREDLLYDSPLKHLHFKRLIIDEGHFFSATNTTAVTVANKLVKADHRWVVSGTPAKDLLGVEVDVSTANAEQSSDTMEGRDLALEGRRKFSAKEDTSGAIKSLGALACNFLQVRPWCGSGLERPLIWDDYIYRHEDARKRTYSGFSSCLRRTLEAMVVKTHPEDVERDIELPPLSHEVVYLEPSYYDKLSANLFTLVLTANAVTSERTDADYLFHKNSAKARYQLINNLRQSAFFWTGFSEADIQASCENGQKYLSKDREETRCSEEDRSLMSDAMEAAHIIYSSTGWKAMSRSHEIGLFVDDWPAESADFWAFNESRYPLLTGVSQLLEAQKHVNGQSAEEDPGEGLNGLGITSLASTRKQTTEPAQEMTVLTNSGIPTSSLNGEPLKRRSASSKGASPQKQLSFKVKKSPASPDSKPNPKKRGAPKAEPANSGSVGERATESPAKKRKRKRSDVEPVTVEEPLRDHLATSAYTKSRIVGTTSAKLSYLLSKILQYHQDEKILVFYDGDNVAYYIAQALELLHIRHEIYAKSLPQHLKSEYIVRFDQEPQDRVLLMDVKQAAYGLNLSSASRIFFVNPVCQPNVEAQAIKRAHRIGQTRKVHVETLVLRGTIEDKMLERAKKMTRSEHQDAKHLEDDGGIRHIIQSARIMPISDEEASARGQVAPLEVTQRLWAREGWKEALEYEAIGNARSVIDKKPAKRAKRAKSASLAATGETTAPPNNVQGSPDGSHDEAPKSTNTRPPEQQMQSQTPTTTDPDSADEDEPLLIQRLRKGMLGPSDPSLPTMPTTSATPALTTEAEGTSTSSSGSAPLGVPSQGSDQS